MPSYTGNWSFSSLQDYESCALRFRLKKIERSPEPPLPPGNPLERGNREHDILYKYVTHQSDTLRDSTAKKIDAFVPVLDHLRELHTAGMVTAEENWFHDSEWEPCDRGDVWLWLKLDAGVLDEENGRVVVVDYKTGKSAYKAASHVDQMMLYAASAAIRYDWANHIDVELWYIDEGHTKPMEFTRDEALKVIGWFDARVKRIYDDKLFRANPNAVTCRWCPYRPHSKGGTGACPVGV